ncbi:winged helix-turn-helix domain-containing protein [Vibrio splendidus]|uniref:winged helix-turn-helix domain-containing protein n=1 Tax=Vibrio splendidus TaxID=29497 RepID=UPI00076A1EE6|nr:winged helix-turn-helix domain-containing protein [Vibrio splendidus]
MKQQSYQICDARYDPLLRQFVREDGHVETIAPIEGKVFLFLLENAGECIERGLIFDRCWGNVIVSEQALTNVISKIRKTLSRVTCGCATIRTVSKTGYSLEIDESIKPSKTEIVPSQVTAKASKSNFSLIAKEVLAATEISTDVNTATGTDSGFKTSSNQQPNSAELEPSNSKSNAHVVKAGYLVALICVVVTAFNLFQTYYTPQPYFIDKAEYSDSYTYHTNHYFFYITHNGIYSLPEIIQKLTDVIPSQCNVDVFVRIYPSVDQPESDALYMLVQRRNGEALNYGASIFNVESSFDSFTQYMKKRSDFCD